MKSNCEGIMSEETEDKKCDISGCERKAVGTQTDQGVFEGYITIQVCEKHAWPVLAATKPGESGHGINIAWERFPEPELSRQELSELTVEIGQELGKYMNKRQNES